MALVGCGGRGTGAAAQALSTKGPTKLCAMADVFDTRLQSSLGALSQQCGKQVDVPKERQFLGMDGYKKAIDAIGPGGVALLTTPPAFRPIHVEYAVSKGCHVFMEKSFAVDAPGIRRVLRAGEEASEEEPESRRRPDEPPLRPLGKSRGTNPRRRHRRSDYLLGLPRARSGGLHAEIRRHERDGPSNPQLLQFHLAQRDLLVGLADPQPGRVLLGEERLAHLGPGAGGRQVRTEPDQLFDHYAVEYSFADGTRLFAQGRHMAGCWGFFGDVIHGAKGSAILGEGQSQPRIYKGHNQTPENLIWQYKGPRCNHYQYEHDLLFAAIRQDKPYNEAERCAKAAMTGILGRMAAESGKQITWDEAMASNLELAPGLDQFTMESKPPVMPDAQGRYPVAMPGTTKVL